MPDTHHSSQQPRQEEQQQQQQGAEASAPPGISTSSSKADRFQAVRKSDADKVASVCVAEAQLLLNCVAAPAYNEYRCIPLLKRLRACVEKKFVVDFTLLPDADARAAALADDDGGSCG